MTKIKTVLYGQLKDGKKPLAIQVTFDELPVGTPGRRKHRQIEGDEFSVSPDQFDNKLERLNTKHRQRKQINSLLQDHEKKWQDAIDQLKEQRIPVTWNKLLEVVENRPNNDAFFGVAKTYIEARKHTPTRNYYKNAMSCVERYAKEHGHGELMCSEVDHKFCTEFREWYLAREINGRPASTSSLKGYFKIIAAILNFAIRCGIDCRATYPFKGEDRDGKISIRDIPEQKIYRKLNVAQIEQLEKYTAYDYHDVYWKMHLFSCAANKLPFRNMAFLKWPEIKMINHPDGGKARGFIYKNGKYRNQTMRCFITPEMEAILRYMKKHTKTFNNYVFPIIMQDYEDDAVRDRDIERERKRYHHMKEWCKARTPTPWVEPRTKDPFYIRRMLKCEFYDFNTTRAVKLFLFSHYAKGMNFIDMAKLKWNQFDQIESDGQNIEFFTFLRTKIKDKSDFINVSVTPELKGIIDYFQENKKIYSITDGYVLPIVSKKWKESDDGIYQDIHYMRNEINVALKVVAKNLGWPETYCKNITMYWARHTWAQRALEAGAPKEYIGASLGHKDLKTTSIYLQALDPSLQHKLDHLVLQKKNNKSGTIKEMMPASQLSDIKKTI